MFKRHLFLVILAVCPLVTVALLIINMLSKLILDHIGFCVVSMSSGLGHELQFVFYGVVSLH